MLLLAWMVALAPGIPAPAQAQDRDPILELLQAAAANPFNPLDVVIDGDVVTVSDPDGDQQGFQDPIADIRSGSIYDLPMVPGFLLEDGGPFGCDTVVLCSNRGAAEPEIFDNGAWLVIIGLGGSIADLDPARRYEWGAFFALDRFPTTAVGPGNLIGGFSHLIVARQEGEMRGVFEYGVGTGAFEPFATRTRARLEMDHVGLLVPKDGDLPTMANGWGLYAFSSDLTSQGTGRDVLGNIGDPPTAIGTPPVISFQEAQETAAPIETTPPVESAAPTAAATVSPTPTQGGTETPTGGFGGGNLLLWIALIVIGIVLMLFGWLFFRRRQPAPAPAPAGPIPPTAPPTPPTPPPAPTPPTPPTPEEPTPGDGEPGDGEPGEGRPGEDGGPGGAPPGGGGPMLPGGGSPGGGAGEGLPLPPLPPPPPPPPPKACEDGDEEWRPDKPATSFLIPAADSRVRITCSPTTPALEAWMAQFGFPHGATAAGFAAVDEEELDRLLAGLPTQPSEIHWLFEFQLDEYRLECERKWVCENEVYVPTGETRLNESGPDPYAGRIAVDGPALTVEDVRRAWLQVRQALLGGSAAEAAMDAYRNAC